MENPFEGTEYEELMKELLAKKNDQDKFNQLKRDEFNKREQDNQAYRRGLPGWTCPRCGMGLAPHTSSCPCVPVPFQLPVITCYGVPEYTIDNKSLG